MHPFPLACAIARPGAHLQTPPGRTKRDKRPSAPCSRQQTLEALLAPTAWHPIRSALPICHPPPQLDLELPSPPTHALFTDGPHSLPFSLLRLWNPFSPRRHSADGLLLLHMTRAVRARRSLHPGSSLQPPGLLQSQLQKLDPPKLAACSQPFNHQRRNQYPCPTRGPAATFSPWRFCSA